MKRLLAIFLLSMAPVFVLAAPAWAAPHVAAQLVPETMALAPGGRVSVALEQDVESGWHTYWSNPGDAGYATTVEWHLPPGWRAGNLQWPYPVRQPVGPLMDYGYEGKVWLMSDLTAPANAAPGKVEISADVSWLACRNICVPEQATLRLTLFVGPPSPPDAVTAERFAAARARLPVPSPWPAKYSVDGSIRLFLAASRLAETPPAKAAFFPAREGLIEDAAPQILERASGGIVLAMRPAKTFKRGETLDGVLVLTSAQGSTQALEVHAKTGEVPAALAAAPGKNDGGGGTLWALLFALIGGVILNVMPCVLPVLAMKALALAGQGGSGRREARRDAFAYSLGAILSFVAFGAALAALRAGGEAVGWGFQLQEPKVVAVLALLLFAVGLNFLGVFEIAPIAAGDGLTRKAGPVGAFFTGMLAVAVAAPCTAPFMASAIGFGLTQGALTILGVFAALGLGFALPFLLIGLVPALQRLLPKPGRWMDLFRRVLALPMFAAAAWLVWVLARQVSNDGMWLIAAAFLCVGTALWAWGRSRGLPAAAGAAAALYLVFAVQPAPAPAAESAAAETYSPERLARLRGENRPVFVDVTAAWCITCMVNHEAALARPKVREAFARRGVTMLVADWTNRDAAITRLIEGAGRSGVPLYLFYAPGARAPAVLPQILTEGIVLDAIGAS